jgi:hypothetical protein
LPPLSLACAPVPPFAIPGVISRRYPWLDCARSCYAGARQQRQRLHATDRLAYYSRPKRQC